MCRFQHQKPVLGIDYAFFKGCLQEFMLLLQLPVIFLQLLVLLALYDPPFLQPLGFQIFGFLHRQQPPGYCRIKVLIGGIASAIALDNLFFCRSFGVE